MAASLRLKDNGITVAEMHRNVRPSALYEYAIRYEKAASAAENGRAGAYKDCRVVANSKLREQHSFPPDP
jgi:phosphoenolpyruvate carboxykinase (ATP)